MASNDVKFKIRLVLPPTIQVCVSFNGTDFQKCCQTSEMVTAVIKGLIPATADKLADYHLGYTGLSKDKDIGVAWDHAQTLTQLRQMVAETAAEHVGAVNMKLSKD